MRSSDSLAIAFDLGTTTIAASLLDTASGKRVAATGGLNPQREFGADVVSRLEAALRSPDNLHRMARLVNLEMQRLALELLGIAGADARDLRKIAVAGNPAMEHLLLALPVRSLAFPPYRPLFTSGRTVATSTLGWDLDLETFVFPLPGGFVGGDLVAFLYGCDAHPSLFTLHSSRLYLDLGTNGEMALEAGGKVHATSVAAGPAFEGGNLACGMAALPGAIDRVRFEGERVRVGTIGDKPPAGICGSGVIEAVAALLQAGVLERTGRLRDPAEIPSNLAGRVREIGGRRAFVLYRDASRLLYLDQEDIRQVQLAKGAIRAGMEVLFERAGVRCEDLREVVLTGSFGAVLAPGSLKNVGIFSENMVEIASFVPEGALRGVEKALCAPQGFAAVEGLAEAIKVVPLSGTPAFEKHFLANMDFPEPEN